jgi:hypothetical protein
MLCAVATGGLGGGLADTVLVGVGGTMDDTEAFAIVVVRGGKSVRGDGCFERPAEEMFGWNGKFGVVGIEGGPVPVTVALAFVGVKVVTFWLVADGCPEGEGGGGGNLECRCCTRGLFVAIGTGLLEVI